MTVRVTFRVQLCTLAERFTWLMTKFERAILKRRPSLLVKFDIAILEVRIMLLIVSYTYFVIGRKSKKFHFAEGEF